MPETKERKTFYCSKCNKTMDEKQFYRSNNLEKYPYGVLNQCKKCITMHVNNWEPETYLWILQEADVPYIPDEWDSLMRSYAKDRSKVTGMTIIGRYLSKMQLKQFKDFRWKDTEFLQDMKNKKIEETMKKQGYAATAIAEAIEKASFSIPEEELAEPQYVETPTYQESDPFEQDDDTFLGDFNLTDEDRVYLRLKWGKYRDEEWVQLEQLYNDMMNSYDIQTAGHIDTLKMVCKTSLKANQLIDLGDIDGAQKVVKMYDTLMKSGKFTAAQNKAESGEYVDCVCDIVTICETEGFIPRFYIDKPNDKVDRTLQDIQTYTHQLIMEETNLGNLIEKALKQIEEDKEKEALSDADAADDDEAFEAALFDEHKTIVEDQDFSDFSDFEEGLRQEDNDYMSKLLGAH